MSASTSEPTPDVMASDNEVTKVCWLAMTVWAVPSVVAIVAAYLRTMSVAVCRPVRSLALAFVMSNDRKLAA